MEPALSVACAVHDPVLAEAHLLPSLDALDDPRPTRLLLDNEGNRLGTNLARLYNVLLGLEGPSARAFLHPDVRLAPDFATRVTRTIEALDARGTQWGALGVVGRAWGGSYIAAHELDGPAPVCTLDACCIVIDARHGLRFDDQTFDELHCHVEDYCLQCHDAGLGVLVIPAELEHLSATSSARGTRWGSYDVYRRRLDEKWDDRYPTLQTT